MVFNNDTPHQVAFTALPGFVAGNPALIQVSIEDQFGNLVPNASNQVCLSLGNDCTAGIAPLNINSPFNLPILDNGGLRGNTICVASNGVASFPGLQILKTGSYRIGALATGLASASGTINVVGNMAVGLGFAWNNNIDNVPATGTASAAGLPIDTWGAGNFNNVFGTTSFTVNVTAVDFFGNPTSNLPPGDGAATNPSVVAGTPVTKTTHMISLGVGGASFVSQPNDVALGSNGIAQFNNVQLTDATVNNLQFSATDNTTSTAGLSAVKLTAAPLSPTGNMSEALKATTLATAGSAGGVGLVGSTAPTSPATVDNTTGFVLNFGFTDRNGGSLGSAKPLAGGGTFKVAFFNASNCTFAKFNATSNTATVTGSPVTGVSVMTVNVPTAGTGTVNVQFQTAGTWTVLMYNAFDVTGAYNLVGNTGGPLTIAPGVVTSCQYNMVDCTQNPIGGGTTFPNITGTASSATVNISTQTFDQFGNKSSLDASPTALNKNMHVSFSGATGTLPGAGAPATPVDVPGALHLGTATFQIAITAPFTGTGNVSGAITLATPTGGTGGTLGAYPGAGNTFLIALAGNLNTGSTPVQNNIAGLKFKSPIVNTTSGDSIQDSGSALNGNNVNEITVQLTDANGTVITGSRSGTGAAPGSLALPHFTLTLESRDQFAGFGSGIGSDAGAGFFNQRNKFQGANFNNPGFSVVTETDDLGEAHFLFNQEPFSCNGLVLIISGTGNTLNRACTNPFDIVPGPGDLTTSTNNVQSNVVVTGATNNTVAPFNLGDANFAAAGSSGNIFPAGSGSGALGTATGPGALGQPIFHISDDAGNIATTFQGTATLSLGYQNTATGNLPTAQPGGASTTTFQPFLSGTSVPVLGGTIVFSNLILQGGPNSGGTGTGSFTTFAQTIVLEITNLQSGATLNAAAGPINIITR
jgi:hypothetical protein